MMRRLLSLALSGAALCATLAAQSPPSSTAAAQVPLLLNQRTPLPGVLTGGATGTPEEFEALAAAGFHTFVDLRSDPEVAADVRERALAAGLDYLRIPVSGEADLDLVSVRALDAVLDDESRYPVAVACASGNRSGALLALRMHWLDAEPPEDALDFGRSAGLTRLEPSVRLLLGLPAEPAAEAPPGADAKPPASGARAGS